MTPNGKVSSDKTVYYNETAASLLRMMLLHKLDFSFLVYVKVVPVQQVVHNFTESLMQSASNVLRQVDNVYCILFVQLYGSVSSNKCTYLV